MEDILLLSSSHVKQNKRMDLSANSTSQPLSSQLEDANHGIINYTEYHDCESINNVCKVEIKEEPEEVNDEQEEEKSVGMMVEEIEAKEEECGSEIECVKCYHCGAERWSKEELREHIFSYHSLLFVGIQNGGYIGVKSGQKAFKCVLCDYRTTRRFRMKEHMRKHTGEKPYKCDLCEYRSKYSRELRIHKYKHTGNLPHKCDVCEYRTARLSYLKTHSLRHRGEKPKEQVVGGFRAAVCNDAKDNIGQHKVDKRFKCHMCDYCTEEKLCLMIHIRNHSVNDKQEEGRRGGMKIKEIEVKEEEFGSEIECVKCYHCGEERLSKEELREHIFSYHSRLFVGIQNGGDIGENNGEKTLKCDVCSYRTTRPYRLKVHIRKHTGEKPYKCDVCEYRSTNSSSLRMHKLKHTGDLPYKCDLCGYSATRLSNLRVHSFRHTGEKPYKCNMCEYSTANPSYLKIHYCQHTGDKPYKCDICGYGTVSHSRFRIHCRKHTDENPKKNVNSGFGTAAQNDFIANFVECTDEKRLKCHICDYSTEEKLCLMIHIRNHRVNEEVKSDGMKKEEIDSKEEEFGSERESVKCYHCGEKRLSKVELREHIFSYHSLLFVGKHIGRDFSEMPLCEYSTASSSSFPVHTRKDRTAVSYTYEDPTHQNIDKKRFKCHVCDYSSMDKSLLKIHFRQHTGERPFECNVCEYRTVSNAALKEHLSRHMEKKRFQCNLCNYSTVVNARLKAHIARHTGERAFRCNLCGFTTTTNAYLKRHIHRHVPKEAT